MTLSRSIAIAFINFLLFTVVSGQQSGNLSGTYQLSDEQMIALDSMAVDSIGDELNIPNVFTPNDDEINDFIEVSTNGVTVYEFTIFTRSGSRVYHSESPRVFWDGRTNSGHPLREGIYYYVIEEKGGSDPFEKAGFIYLYR
jgi:gliding motility-associated-like protein